MAKKKRKKSPAKKTSGKKKNPLWKELTSEQKKLYVTILWNELYSDAAIASFFSCTKNAVVGFRHSQLSDLVSDGRSRSSVLQSPPSLERFEDLLRIHKLDELKEKGSIPTADFFAGDVPPSTASTEVVERAVSEGKVTMLRPIENPIEPKGKKTTNQQVETPSTTDLPFLPPPEDKPKETKTDEKVEEASSSKDLPMEQAQMPAKFIAEEVTHSQRLCQWRKDGGCSNKAEPHSILCKYHRKFARPGPYGPQMD